MLFVNIATISLLDLATCIKLCQVNFISAEVAKQLHTIIQVPFKVTTSLPCITLEESNSFLNVTHARFVSDVTAFLEDPKRFLIFINNDAVSTEVFEGVNIDSISDAVVSTNCDERSDVNVAVEVLEGGDTSPTSDETVSTICDGCRDAGVAAGVIEGGDTSPTSDETVSTICDECRDAGVAAGVIEGGDTSPTSDETVSTICDECRDADVAAGVIEGGDTSPTSDETVSTICDECRDADVAAGVLGVSDREQLERENAIRNKIDYSKYHNPNYIGLITEEEKQHRLTAVDSENRPLFVRAESNKNF